MMRENNTVLNKSKSFAIRIVKLYQYLFDNKEFVMSKQILRCGTSIGANITEGNYAQSHADFISKMNIALKEAAETEVQSSSAIFSRTSLLVAELGFEFRPCWILKSML